MGNNVATLNSAGSLSEDRVLEVLKGSLYPGAREDSIRMVLDYCRAAELDPMQKPVHIVPMWVKDPTTGQGGMRDTVMPGIGLYRVQAARSGEHAGTSEPEFGPEVTAQLGNVQVVYPEWCRVTVYRMRGGQAYPFTAKELWIENYATAGKDNEAPNAMWRKRRYGQLAKCTEAQALRKAFPEFGSAPTAEEMEGKDLAPAEREATQPRRESRTQLPEYPQASLDQNQEKWRAAIQAGKTTPEEIISKVETKGTLTDNQKRQIHNLAAIDAEEVTDENA